MNIQDANPLGPVHLVTGKRKKVNSELIDINAAPDKQLGGIGMKKRAVGMRDFCDLRQWCQDTGLVVGGHDGHQESLIVNSVA